MSIPRSIAILACTATLMAIIVIAGTKVGPTTKGDVILKVTETADIETEHCSGSWTNCEKMIETPTLTCTPETGCPKLLNCTKTWGTNRAASWEKQKAAGLNKASLIQQKQAIEKDNKLYFSMGNFTYKIEEAETLVAVFCASAFRSGMSGVSILLFASIGVVATIIS